MLDAKNTHIFFLVLIISSIVFALGIFLFPVHAAAAVTPDDPGNFITTWNTENSGSSNDNQIIIPGTGAGYNYEIYWENTASSTINGTTSPITSSSYTLTFPEPGIYEVQISGDFPRVRVGGDRDKLLTVEQWGDMQWTSMTDAFRDADNLRIPATDAPDLSGVTSMNSMFFGATSFNDPINHWDVSNVANMSSMFYGARDFDQDLDQWDTSSVTDMAMMFRNASDFNGDISTWDTSNVESMFFMFISAGPFNSDISGWDTGKVTNFSSMFNGADEFNQPIGSWDMSSSTDISFMFYNAEVFNQPLNNWDVSSVETMRRTFSDTTEFNQPLDQWDTSSVTDMRNTFSYTQLGDRSPTAFDQNLSTWDVENVTTMGGMFLDAALSTQNQDATLAGWAAQTLQSNVPLHVGLKSYTEVGAAAIATFEDTYNWTITEQYQAEYAPSSDAILIGTAIQAPINSGATTTEVEIRPKNNCTFTQWSDGRTDNPRQDALTDNLFVIAELECRSTSGTSAGGRAAALERQGKDAEAAAVRDRFGLNDRTTTSTPATYQPPETLEASLEEVKALDLTNLDPVTDRDTINQIIKVLLELVQALTLLMMGTTNEPTT